MDSGFDDGDNDDDDDDDDNNNNNNISITNSSPPSELLYDLNTGYEENTTKIKIANLLIVGDLNMIGKTEEELQNQIQIFKNLSDVIHIE